MRDEVRNNDDSQQGIRMAKMLRMSPEQYAAHQGKAAPVAAKKKNKYNAERVYLDRIWFDSKGEADRYGVLRERAGNYLITQLVVHPVFPLHAPDGTTIATYTADFRYRDFDGNEVVEDFKSPVTAKMAAFLRNVRHVKAEYGITITVVMKGQQ